MKITGVKQLNKKFKRFPKQAEIAIEKATKRTVKTGVVKAIALSPRVTGDLISKYSSHVVKNGKGIFGFINLHDKTRDSVLKFGAVSFGRKTGNRGTTTPYHIRQALMSIVAKKHKNMVKRNIKKAMKETFNG